MNITDGGQTVTATSAAELHRAISFLQLRRWCLNTPGEAIPPSTHKPKGFAAIDPVRQREIAAMGGRAAQAKGVAHRWDAAEARAAGRIGGLRGKRRVSA